MDVVLLAASVASAARFGSKDALQASTSVRVALGISFCLFSLSLLEVCPSGWLVFLGNKTSLSIVGAYRILLWMISLGIVIALPASIGSQMMSYSVTCAARRMHTSSITGDSDFYTKKQKVQLLQLLPWWLRYTLGLLGILLWRLTYRVVLAPFFSVFRIKFRPPKTTRDQLPITAKISDLEGSPSSMPSSSPTKDFAFHLAHPSSRMVPLVGSVCGVATSLVVLRLIGSFTVRLPDPHVLSTIVSWVCAVGMLVSGILNGFGSVSMPHECLVGLYLEPVRPEILQSAEAELRKTTQSRQGKLQELIGEPSSLSTKRRSAALTTRKSFGDLGDEETRRKALLQDEIEVLDAIIGDLRDDIAEMKLAQKQAAQARTTIGKIKSYVGVVFSIVLVVRLYLAIKSVTSFDINQTDPITTALLWLTGNHYINQEDYDTISQTVSLFLTAFLSVSQVRNFLRTAAGVNRRLVVLYRKCYWPWQRSAGIRAEESFLRILDRVLAGLTGCYVVSCVVLTKRLLPEEYRMGFTEALGGMELDIHIKLINFVYSVSAGVTAATMGILFGIHRQNTKRYINDHEMALRDWRCC